MQASDYWRFNLHEYPMGGAHQGSCQSCGGDMLLNLIHLPKEQPLLLTLDKACS